MAKQKQPSKPCQKCNDKPAIQGEKYCTGCRKSVLSEMAESGYLENRPAGTFSDERGRKNRADYKTLGGSAEMGSDGDVW